jgi:signal transduction histidine kinase
MIRISCLFVRWLSCRQTTIIADRQDLLAKGEVPEKELLLEQLSLVHRNSLRLLKLVNSLLDFSKIEAGRMQASFRPLDLTQLTQDLTSTFRSAAERYARHAPRHSPTRHARHARTILPANVLTFVCHTGLG